MDETQQADFDAMLWETMSWHRRKRISDFYGYTNCPPPPAYTSEEWEKATDIFNNLETRFMEHLRRAVPLNRFTRPEAYVVATLLMYFHIQGNQWITFTYDELIRDSRRVTVNDKRQRGNVQWGTIRDVLRKLSEAGFAKWESGYRMWDMAAGVWEARKTKLTLNDFDGVSSLPVLTFRYPSLMPTTLDYEEFEFSNPTPKAANEEKHYGGTYTRGLALDLQEQWVLRLGFRDLMREQYTADKSQGWKARATRYLKEELAQAGVADLYSYEGIGAFFQKETQYGTKTFEVYEHTLTYTPDQLPAIQAAVDRTEARLGDSQLTLKMMQGWS